MNVMKASLMGLALMLGMTACTSTHRSMREPNVRVDLTKADFTLSDQVSGEASTTRIFWIDFTRLFNKTTGAIDNPAAAQAMPLSLTAIPVIGTALLDPTSNYALYEMMKSNPGYDVVFYPQYETKVIRPLGIGIVKTTTVKATARLGKLNK
jgi:hypothetical protein